MIGELFNGHPPATLVRQYTGRLVDISSNGCLIEIPAVLTPGMVGRLEAVIDGKIHAEAARVTRVALGRDRTSPTFVGFEFLLVAPPGAQSIRTAIARLADGADPLITFVH